MTQWIKDIILVTGALWMATAAAISIFAAFLVLKKISPPKLKKYAENLTNNNRTVAEVMLGENNIDHPDSIQGIAIDEKGNIKRKSSYSEAATARLFIE